MVRAHDSSITDYRGLGKSDYGRHPQSPIITSCAMTERHHLCTTSDSRLFLLAKSGQVPRALEDLSSLFFSNGVSPGLKVRVVNFSHGYQS